MNICSHCERSFNHKNSLRRHQTRRLHPCKPIIASCVDCGNKFTSRESLKKHERLYWKRRITLQSFIEQFPSMIPSATATSPHNFMHTPQPLTTDDTSEAKNIFSSDSLQELLNQIQFSPMMSNTVDDKPIAMMSNTVDDKPIDNVTAADAAAAVVDGNELQRDREVLNHLDDILTTWLSEIHRLEGVHRSHSLVKEEIFAVLYRMLQDGLITNVEYDDLVYTSNLFIRLHDLITMYIPTHHKQSVIEILIDLYDMKKITRMVLIELCVNL